jgi:hypothetical protein
MSAPRQRNHPIEEMMEHLKYDASTGKVIWIKNGKEAGHLRPPWKGCHVSYRTFYFKGLDYLTHRFVFASTHGRWPIGFIDHIDGNAQNNAPENLREVTMQENSRNRPITRRSKTGVLGVTWQKQLETWRVTIKHEGKDLRLGYTMDFFEAICLRKSAETSLGYHPNHGRPIYQPTESGASE